MDDMISVDSIDLLIDESNSGWCQCQCPIPFSQFSCTIFQYFSLLRTLTPFPHLTTTKNTAEHAIPIKAAEIKQFWYPRLWIHGVILHYLAFDAF